MALRPILLSAVFAMSGFLPIGFASANDFIYGCWSRGACGKVCKLVCEKQTLVSTCYACECAEICIPAPSRPGCKHCAACCKPEATDDGSCRGSGSCEEKGPKCEFCWRDWVACGCARPRTVKVLTKYQAEKDVCSYHWEVVDAAECRCAPNDETTAARQGAGCQCVYKPAPVGAELGAVLPVSAEERAQLASYIADANQPAELDAAHDGLVPQEAKSDANSKDADATIWQRIGRWFNGGNN